ncbi:MAG: ATP-binding cassette domain-containing protein [Planctomycetia bacterium]|nr:ATP-binding cassette domain-containing protein [Planctomycetia bacterium]
MTAAFVVTEKLTKSYGSVVALRDCSLEVHRGEVFGLLGPNGAGKTTLLRVLMGFLKPTAGRATIDGLDCHEESVAVHHRVSYLPGDARLFRRMRGRDVLKFFSRVRPEGNLDRAVDLARRFDLDLSRVVANSSTGMRQKLALCAVLSVDVPLWIIDEPTSHLDPTARHTVVSLVKEAKAAGRTVVFSSHVLSEVEEACDRVAVLRSGELVHTQIMSQLRRRHRIRARLNDGAPVGPLPPALAGAEVQSHDGGLVVETPGDLAPLLGWLASLSVAEIQIEPLGLRAVYERFHAPAVEEP